MVANPHSLTEFPVTLMEINFKRLVCCDTVSSRLAISLCGIPLRSPVLAASGTYAYGIELQGVVDLAQLGGVITKGLSREPMQGNAAPRLFETEAGMMNSVGLQNIGVRAFVAEKLPALRAIPTAVVANVFTSESASAPASAAASAIS